MKAIIKLGLVLLVLGFMQSCRKTSCWVTPYEEGRSADHTHAPTFTEKDIEDNP